MEADFALLQTLRNAEAACLWAILSKGKYFAYRLCIIIGHP